jgi:predicted Zn-dependent protease
MPEIIRCPDCGRRLRLPSEHSIETARCPSCGAQFSAESALAVTTPDTAIAASPSPRESRPVPIAAGARERTDGRPRARSSVKQWLIALAVLGGLVLVVGLAGVGAWSVFEAGLGRSSSPPPIAAGDDPADPWQGMGKGFGGPDAPPEADLRIGSALNRAGQWEEALKHLEAHRDRHGDSAEVCRELGLALRGCNRFPDAARAYRRALDLDPTDADAFLGLLRSLEDGDNNDDLAARFVKLDNLRDNFVVCAEDLEQRMFPSLLETLAQAMRKLAPEFAPADYYLALSRARTGQSQEALALFKSALAKEPDEEGRRRYEEGFFKVMASVGKAAEVYADAPDGRAAFRLLAPEAMRHYQLEGLRRLVNAHAKKHADDPLLPLYRAEVYVKEGRYALAEKAFAAALAARPDQETLKPFRPSRVLARYHTGQALSAYREIGPRQDTFLQLAHLCMGEEDFAGLQALLDEHAKNDPDSLEILRFRSRLKLRHGQVAEATALFKSALAKADYQQREVVVSEFLAESVAAGKPLEGYRAAPDAEQAFEILAEDLQEQDRRDDLRRLIEAHRAGHPADPWLAFYQSDVHLEDKDYDKAARVLGEAMKRAPRNLRDQLRWKYIFAMYKAGRGLQAYEESEPRHPAFTQLANLLAGDKKGAELEALVKAHRAQDADDPDVFYFAARARILLKQPAEAGALLVRAYQQQPQESLRKSYVTQLALDMEQVGQGLEGYRASPDKPAAFETLAFRLVSQKKDGELAALLEEHARAHAKDPLHEFFTGELLLLRGDADQAARRFAACLARVPSRDQWRFRDALLRARLKAGQVVAAYQESEPGSQTFELLASKCVQFKDAKQLRALLDAHRKADPDDANAPGWELQVYWLNQDYEGALKLLAENREGVFDLPRWRWQADDFRVRCLLKLKRTEDAVREAEAIAKTRDGNRVLLVLAHASSGDVKQTIAVVEKLRTQPYLVASCYQDEDLGAILRSEPFRAFREKFPEPEDKPGRGGFDPDDP